MITAASSRTTRRATLAGCLAALALFGTLATASAAPVTIVALGTSNTRGRGVPPQESYPAQLQAMLKAHGVDARVINMGVNGDTTAGMLARLSSIPSGTRLVLFEYWPLNESRRKVTDTSANVAAIHARLAARNIKVIDILGIVESVRGTARAAGNFIATPAGPHLNGAGYAAVAAQLLPQVEAAVGQ